MAKPKRLSDKGFHVRFAKKDIDWIQQEALYRRLAPTHLIVWPYSIGFGRMPRLKNLKRRKNEITLFSRFDEEIESCSNLLRLFSCALLSMKV